MPINRLYDTWKTRILELRPDQRITQIRAFVWLMPIQPRPSSPTVVPAICRWFMVNTPNLSTNRNRSDYNTMITRIVDIIMRS
jgi:hypothetical protein